MDEDFWSTDKVNEFKDNLIFVKIDIDSNRRLASKFGVRGIPYVVLTDIAENKIWDIVGYQSGKNFTKILKGIPTQVEQINKVELPFLKNKESVEDFMNVGKTYAEIGKDLPNNEMKKAFLRLSTQTFKKIKKGKISKEAELRILLNKAYLGQTKKVRKKLDKITK